MNQQIKRLHSINNHFESANVARKNPTLNVWESLGNDTLLRPSVAEKRKAVSRMM